MKRWIAVLLALMLMTVTPSALGDAIEKKGCFYASGSKAQVCDIYVPDGEGPFPVIILVHGGGFLFGDSGMPVIQPVIEAAKQRGYALASVDYRKSSEAVFPAALADVKAAVRFVRTAAGRYGFDAERVVLWGESAGAYLAWTFSPVSDLDLNSLNPITNVRTYGSDVQRVMRCTRGYMQTVQACGVAACAEHFPGDGVDGRDQHLHPTYNTLCAKEWYETYGAVYRNLIEGGLLSVMAGHIAAPYVEMELDPQKTPRDCLPASLNPTLLQGVLRDRLGFNGLITTDATIMGGYCMAMPRREALPASVMAGCDMLVFSTDFEEDYSFLMTALEDGRLTQERLDEAVRRILALKARVCGRGTEAQEVPARRWRRECACKAVTLVKAIEPGALPISPRQCPLVRLIVQGRDTICDGSMTEIATAWLEQAGYAVEVYDPYADELHGVPKTRCDRLTLYLSNYEQASNQTVVRAGWCQKHALDIPRFLNEETCVYVSFGNPYLLRDVPRIKTYINAYTATRDTIEVTLEKLSGYGEFTGVSPVNAFCGLIDTKF